MTSLNRIHYALWLGVALLAVAALPGCRQAKRDRVFDCPVDENTAIRFFYFPGGDYYHYPLVFRAAARGDARLNTAPMVEEGRTAYVSYRDMRDLLRGLAHSGLSWQESEKVEPLGSHKPLAFLTDDEIRVICSKGTATAHFDPKRICQTLEPLDSAIKTPRALWEFQLFRQGYGCKVRGFNFQAYPDYSH